MEIKINIKGQPDFNHKHLEDGTQVTHFVYPNGFELVSKMKGGLVNTLTNYLIEPDSDNPNSFNPLMDKPNPRWDNVEEFKNKGL